MRFSPLSLGSTWVQLERHTRLECAQLARTRCLGITVVRQHEAAAAAAAAALSHISCVTGRYRAPRGSVARAPTSETLS